jgi:hypothetical protein
LTQTTPPGSGRPRAADARPAAGFAGRLLVWLGVVGVPLGLLLPWSWSAGSWSADQRPDAIAAAGIILLGPVLSLLRVLLGRLDPGYWRISTIAAAAGSAVAAGLAAPAVGRVGSFAGIAPGGPITVLAAAGGALGWVLIWIAGPDSAAAGQAMAMGLVAVAVLAVGAFAGTQWYTEDRFVDHTTAAPLPATAPAAPAQLDRERWRQTVAATSVHAAGRYLVVGEPAGVRVLDSLTGKQRWSYRRSDMRTKAVAVNGTTAVAVYESAGGVVAVGLDVATGSPRWRQRYTTSAERIWRADRLVPAGRVVTVLPLGGASGDVIALDVDSGAVRWTWRPERPDGACTIHDVAATDSVLAFATRCPRDGVARDTVIALSTVDGRQRWSWEPSYPTGVARGDEPSVATANGNFLVGYGQFARAAVDGSPVTLRAPRSSASLDVVTGSVRASYEAPGRFVAVIGDIALYLGDTATAVNVTNGIARWNKSIAGLSDVTPQAVTGRDGKAYLLLREPRTDQAVSGDSGPLRLVAVDVSSGEVRLDRRYPLGDPRCARGNDGQPRCDIRPAGLVLGPGVAIVYQQPEQVAPAADLAALG